MKRFLALTSILLLVATIPVVQSVTPPQKLWALIVAAEGVDPLYYLPHLDPPYMWTVLLDYYDFDEIKFMADSYTKQDVRNAIRNWLFEKSSSNDLIFIYIDGHGGGVYKYNETVYIWQGGRVELNSDEGNEVSETQLANGTYQDGMWKNLNIGIDLNGNGVIEPDVYVGVDEGIQIRMAIHATPEMYWDDEVKEDLDYLAEHGKYNRLVFCFQGGRSINGTEGGCFSGGFIRDLSAPNRIIISETTETNFGWGYTSEDGHIGYFSREFIHALNPDGVYEYDEFGFPKIDPDTGEPIWTDSFGIADSNNDEIVSVWEAWKYAYNNDPAVVGFHDALGKWVQETPQLDDNGDGFISHGHLGGDGLFSMETCFISGVNLKTPDINEDGCIDIYDSIKTAVRYGDEGESPADYNNDLIVDIYDVLILASHFGKCY